MSSVSMKRAASRPASPVKPIHPETDPLCLGQGVLVDADILKEAARLHALHVEQRPETSPLLAGPAPRVLLSLFRHAPVALES